MLTFKKLYYIIKVWKDKIKLKAWVKVVLFLIFIFDLFLIGYDLKNHKTIVNEVGKHYTCYGTLIQVCSGEDYDAR